MVHTLILNMFVYNLGGVFNVVLILYFMFGKQLIIMGMAKQNLANNQSSENHPWLTTWYL